MIFFYSSRPNCSAVSSRLLWKWAAPLPRNSKSSAWTKKSNCRVENRWTIGLQEKKRKKRKERGNHRERWPVPIGRRRTNQESSAHTARKRPKKETTTTKKLGTPHQRSSHVGCGQIRVTFPLFRFRPSILFEKKNLLFFFGLDGGFSVEPQTLKERGRKKIRAHHHRVVGRLSTVVEEKKKNTVADGSRPSVTVDFTIQGRPARSTSFFLVGPNMAALSSSTRFSPSRTRRNSSFFFWFFFVFFRLGGSVSADSVADSTETKKRRE